MAASFTCDKARHRHKIHILDLINDKLNYSPLLKLSLDTEINIFCLADWQIFSDYKNNSTGKIIPEPHLGLLTCIQ